jgi:hypothetical protein
MCDTCFSARADAVYCSSACRQKAHRERTARRIAELSDLVEQSSGRNLTSRDIAASRTRVRDVVNRSRELCGTPAERIREAAEIEQRSRQNRSAIRPLPEDFSAAPTSHFMERASWRGD